MSKDIVVKYRRNDYGGIDVVELNYSADEVYTNGELEDSYESVEEYLNDSKRLYNSLLKCAMAVEKTDKVLVAKSEYERLQRDSEFLGCLEACGVDNWSGYGDAQEMMKTGEDEL